MPDGAELVGRDAMTFRMQITVPSDEDGFVGRECPECEMTFRMDASRCEGIGNLWCVYCGHHAEYAEFLTAQQRNRAVQAAEDLGAQLVHESMRHIFRGLSRPGSRRSVSVSGTARPFRPRPLPGINEERLVRVRTCQECQMRYAIFGEHRYCPVCGKLSAVTIAFDALQADVNRLEALNALPPETRAVLREQGVFTRNWVDTIENVVGVAEALASAVFRAAVPNADDILRGKGSIFQRLDDMADLFVAQGFADLRAGLGPDLWRRLIECWAARHVLTHNDGVVDDKYLAKVPASSSRVGQRLVISEAKCRQAIDDAKTLCGAIAQLTD